MHRHIYLALGIVCVALGIIGAVLPLMPTTIFLIMAAYFFGRSSERLERRILDHPRFGPPVRAWRQEGAIGLRGKIAACTGMAIGFAIFMTTANVRPEIQVLAALFILASAAFVVSRPRPSSERNSA